MRAHAVMAKPTVTAAFVPTDIAGCVLWLDATNAGSITSSGSPALVSQWSDLSGSGNHATQGTDSRKPRTGTRTINGLNALDFDGGDRLDTSLTASDVTCSAFGAVLCDSVTGNRTLLGGRTTNGFHLVIQDGFGLYVANQNAAVLGDPYNTSFSTGVAMIWGARLTSTAVKVYFNNASQATSGSYSLTGSKTTNVGAGDNGGTPESFFDGAIGEVIKYDTSLSDADVTSVITYLNAKWAAF